MTRTRNYFIHNNGGRPYKVSIKDNYLDLYRIVDYENEIYENQPYLHISLTGKKVFLPKRHPMTPSYYTQPTISYARGNSILVQLAPHIYLYIGPNVYIFETPDEIREYYSPIGNSDVPYPWAVGTENVYFMIEEAAIPIEEITHLGDPYMDYYELYKKVQEPKYPVRMILRSVMRHQR